jgi:glucokinase
VIGPGTGLGEGIMAKADAKSLYEPFPSEGGHSDFAVRDKEDFDLREFALKYLETSKNTENLKCTRKTHRLCAEALVAGPGIPLIYEFMKEQYKDLPRPLETEKKINLVDMTSKDIISHAI